MWMLVCESMLSMCECWACVNAEHVWMLKGPWGYPLICWVELTTVWLVCGGSSCKNYWKKMRPAKKLLFHFQKSREEGRHLCNWSDGVNCICLKSFEVLLAKTIDTLLFSGLPVLALSACVWYGLLTGHVLCMFSLGWLPMLTKASCHAARTPFWCVVYACIQHFLFFKVTRRNCAGCLHPHQLSKMIFLPAGQKQNGIPTNVM